MGSTFTKSPPGKQGKSLFGKDKQRPIYLQFVPGVVVSCITSVTNVSYEGESQINSIIAQPHIMSHGIKSYGMRGEESRYKPLFRGITDVPTPGDPVLLCTFAGQQYYIGPLNTDNQPNANKDYFAGDQIFASNNPKGIYTDEEITPRTLAATAFFRKRVTRLHKEPNTFLDFPSWKEGDPITTSVAPDMIFEGRFGNSIRIGQRNINPYIMISNGRPYLNPIETSLDGSIFCMFKHGSIRQHFPHDKKMEGEGEDNKKIKYSFTLADNELEKVHKSITNSYQKNIGRGKTEAGEDDPNIESTIYDYGNNENPGHQIFASSDRITFNAKKDNIFLSAFKHIHIGSGNSMTFSTSNNFLFEGATSSITNVPLFKVNSEQVYIDGRKEIVLGNPVLDKGQLHSGVLGEYLLASLNSIITDVKQLATATSRALENRAATGESVTTMMDIVDTLDDTQKLMNDTILSDIVSLK